jgi:hypothetical protein
MATTLSSVSPSSSSSSILSLSHQQLQFINNHRYYHHQYDNHGYQSHHANHAQYPSLTLPISSLDLPQPITSTSSSIVTPTATSNGGVAIGLTTRTRDTNRTNSSSNKLQKESKSVKISVRPSLLSAATTLEVASSIIPTPTVISSTSLNLSIPSSSTTTTALSNNNDDDNIDEASSTTTRIIKVTRRTRRSTFGRCCRACRVPYSTLWRLLLELVVIWLYVAVTFYYVLSGTWSHAFHDNTHIMITPFDIMCSPSFTRQSWDIIRASPASSPRMRSGMDADYTISYDFIMNGQRWSIAILVLACVLLIITLIMCIAHKSIAVEIRLTMRLIFVTAMGNPHSRLIGQSYYSPLLMYSYTGGMSTVTLCWLGSDSWSTYEPQASLLYRGTQPIDLENSSDPWVCILCSTIIAISLTTPYNE